MQVTTIGVDLAKNVFQVRGITESEEVVFNRPLRRAQFLSFFEKLDPCLVGMESCSSAHHWARDLLVRQRTQLINGLRGRLPSSAFSFREAWPV